MDKPTYAVARAPHTNEENCGGEWLRVNLLALVNLRVGRLSPGELDEVTKMLPFGRQYDDALNAMSVDDRQWDSYIAEVRSRIAKLATVDIEHTWFGGQEVLVAEQGTPGYTLLELANNAALFDEPVTADEIVELSANDLTGSGALFDQEPLLQVYGLAGDTGESDVYRVHFGGTVHELRAGDDQYWLITDLLRALEAGRR